MSETVFPPATVEAFIDVAWRALPTPEEDADLAIEKLITSLEVDEAAERGLRTGLGSVNVLAHRLTTGNRRSYALVRNPASGIVDALLSTKLSQVEPDAYDQYFAAIRATDVADGFEIINRTLIETRLPAGRAIVLHDFTATDDSGGMPEPALERAILALFVDGSAALIEFYLAAQNLALFADMEEFLITLASGERARTPAVTT